MKTINFIFSLQVFLTTFLNNVVLEKKFDPVLVGTSTLEYSKEWMMAERLHRCSVVILDYVNQAGFAHVYYMRPGKLNNPSYIYSGNVVGKLTEEFRTRGINPQETEAIVSSGNDEDLQTIVKDLREKGIKIRLAKNDYDIRGRDVYYDPTTDSFYVRIRNDVDLSKIKPETLDRIKRNY